MSEPFFEEKVFTHAAGRIQANTPTTLMFRQAEGISPFLQLRQNPQSITQSPVTLSPVQRSYVASDGFDHTGPFMAGRIRGNIVSALRGFALRVRRLPHI